MMNKHMLNGNLTIHDNDRVKITAGNLDLYFLVGKGDILNINNESLDVQVKQGAPVEMHFKHGGNHSFIMDYQKLKPFGLDIDTGKIYNFEDSDKDLPYYCSARMSGWWKVKCCNSDIHFKGFVADLHAWCPTSVKFPVCCANGVLNNQNEHPQVELLGSNTTDGE